MCLTEYSASEKTVLKSKKVTQFYYRQIIVAVRRENQICRLSSGKIILKQLLTLEIRMMKNSVMNLIPHTQMVVLLERNSRLFLKFLQLIRAPVLSLVNFLIMDT